MTYKNFKKKDSFRKILIEETGFLSVAIIVGGITISMVIAFLVRNRTLFLDLYGYFSSAVPDTVAYIFAYILTGCIIFMVLIPSLIIAIVVLLKLITFFRKTYSKLSHACMLNRICHLPFTVEEMEKYRTSGLGQLLLLVLKMETYKEYVDEEFCVDEKYCNVQEYDIPKLRPVLTGMYMVRKKNKQLYENIKIVFKEDFDDNGFLKKDIRNTVHTFLCEETDIDKKSITSFLDHLDAGKDF